MPPGDRNHRNPKGGIESMSTATKKPAKMALDYVEPGNGLSDDSAVTTQVPAGVTQKMLYKDIIQIAWPALVELTLTQLTSMADLMMVGQLGPWAITAVGLCTQPKFLLQTAFMAMNVGATAMVARYKGAGDQQKANNIMRQALTMTLVFSAIAAILGYIFAEPLIRFLGTSDDAQAFAGAISYFRIQMIGLVGLALTSTITATLRGVGSSKTAMMYNMVANVVNVIFNYILIYGNFGAPRMEVAGASLATIIGQFVAMILAFISLFSGKFYLRLRIGDSFKPDLGEIRRIAKIGIPAMGEQLIMRAGMILFVKTVSSLGTMAFATHQVCMNIQALSFMTGQAFGTSATSLVGQSLGKKRSDMAQAYSLRTRRISMVVALLLTVIFFFFGEFIVSLYNNDPEIVATGGKILMFVAFIQPFQSSQFVLSGALRGAGDTKAVARVIFITTLLIRPFLAMFLINVIGFGLEGAWIALVTDQLMRTFLIWKRYNSGKWKSIKV